MGKQIFTGNKGTRYLNMVMKNEKENNALRWRLF